MNYYVLIQDRIYSIEIVDDGDTQQILWEGKQVDMDCNLQHSNPFSSIILNGRPYEIAVKREAGTFDIHLNQTECKISVTRGGKQSDKTVLLKQSTGLEIITAPMPGLVVDVKVTEDQEVEMGTPLLVLEAMKMENELRSPVSGRIKEVHSIKGKKVEKGEKLIMIEK